MKLSELTPDAVDYILSNLDEEKLSRWERDTFLPSIADQWERRRWLSDRQKEILGEIWDKQP